MRNHMLARSARALRHLSPSPQPTLMPARRRLCAPAAAPDDSTSAAPATVSPRIASLLDDLVSLNMLEVKQLTEALKDRLGITDAPAMPMGFNPALFAGAAGAPGAAPEVPAEPEKTHFNLKLESFDAGKKIAVIKEIRSITGLGLKEAKTLVEDAPKLFKNDVAKAEAEQLRDKLKELGAEVVLE